MTIAKPSKVIFEIVTNDQFYRIKKTQFFSGDEGNPPLVKLLKFRTTDPDTIISVAKRCARGKKDEGYSVRWSDELEWTCELDLDGE